MTTKEEAVQAMIEKIFQFNAGSQICPYCNTVLLKGETITEKTKPVTSCENCHKSFIE